MLSFETAPGPNVPRRFYGWLTPLGRWWLRRSGWATERDLPNVGCSVIAVAPHSSNWDFVYGIAIIFAYEINVGFLGKHTLFQFPLGSFMRWLGGVPVDRRKPSGVVDAITRELGDSNPRWFGWAPEGSRSSSGAFKSGFYRVAQQANLPIVPVYINYKTKRFGFLPPVTPTADIDGGVESIRQMLEQHGCRKEKA